MHRRWLTVAMIVGAALALIAFFFARQRGPPADAAASVEIEGTVDAGRSSARRIAVARVDPQRPGSLRLRGRVLGPGGPVAGATVLATTAHGDDILSEQMCQCDDACGKRLLDCGCAESARQLMEYVGQRRGEAIPLGQATTAADGTFELNGLGEGELALWAEKKDLGVAVDTQVQAGADAVELTLAPGQVIRGTTLDEDEHALAGAIVTAVYDAHSRFFDAVTDAHGAFRIGPVPNGSFRLVASAVGFLPESSSLEQGESQGPVSLTLQRPRRITGVLTSDDGPVASATVHLAGEHKKVDVTTDPAGRFAFVTLRKGDYELRVERGADGAFQTVQLGRGNVDDLVLHLGAKRTVEVQVQSKDGSPIANADVTVSAAARTSPSFKAKTGADGRARIEVFGASRWSISASAPGFTDGFAQLTPEQDVPAQIALEAEAVLSGIVVDERGRGVPSASVSAFDSEGAQYKYATTDGDGGFRIGNLVPATFELSVRAAKLAPVSLNVTAPSIGLRVTLAAGGIVAGTVLDADGKPVAGATVSAVPMTPGEYSKGMGKDVTRANGDFEISGLGDARYLLTARLEEGMDGGGTLTHHAATRTEIRGGTAPRVLLQFNGGKPITGVVVDASDNPIADVNVTATPSGGSGMPWARTASEREATSRATTRPDGRFALADLPPGSYDVTAQQEGYAPKTVTASLGDDLRIQLARPAQISGKVVDARGQPLSEFEINGRSFAGNGGRFQFPSRSEEFPDWFPGGSHLVLRFRADGFAPFDKVIEPRPEGDLDVGTITLTTGWRLRGTLVDAVTHQHLSEGSVARSGSGPARAIDDGEGASAEVDGSGAFTLANLPDGPVQVAANSEGHQETRLTVTEAQGDVTIELRPAGAIRGRVLDAKGNTVAGATVRAHGWEDSSGERSARTGANGAYLLSGLNSGAYWVDVSAPSVSIPAQRTSVSSGATAELNFQAPSDGATLTVTLKTPDDAPTPRQIILIQGQVPVPATAKDFEKAGGPILTPIVNDGVQTFSDIPGGTYSMFVLEFRGPKNMAVGRQLIQVPAQGTLSVVADLPPDVIVSTDLPQ